MERRMRATTFPKDQAPKAFSSVASTVKECGGLWWMFTEAFPAHSRDPFVQRRQKRDGFPISCLVNVAASRLFGAHNLPPDGWGQQHFQRPSTKTFFQWCQYSEGVRRPVMNVHWSLSSPLQGSFCATQAKEREREIYIYILRKPADRQGCVVVCERSEY